MTADGPTLSGAALAGCGFIRTATAGLHFQQPLKSGEAADGARDEKAHRVGLPQASGAGKLPHPARAAVLPALRATGIEV